MLKIFINIEFYSYTRILICIPVTSASTSVPWDSTLARCVATYWQPRRNPKTRHISSGSCSATDWGRRFGANLSNGSALGRLESSTELRKVCRDDWPPGSVSSITLDLDTLILSKSKENLKVEIHYGGNFFQKINNGIEYIHLFCSFDIN